MHKKKKITSSKLKAFADKNFIVAQIVRLFFDRIENITVKGENAGKHDYFTYKNINEFLKPAGQVGI